MATSIVMPFVRSGCGLAPGGGHSLRNSFNVSTRRSLSKSDPQRKTHDRRAESTTSIRLLSPPPRSTAIGYAEVSLESGLLHERRKPTALRHDSSMQRAVLPSRRRTPSRSAVASLPFSAADAPPPPGACGGGSPRLRFCTGLSLTSKLALPAATNAVHASRKLAWTCTNPPLTATAPALLPSPSHDAER